MSEESRIESVSGVGVPAISHFTFKIIICDLIGLFIYLNIGLLRVIIY